MTQETSRSVAETIKNSLNNIATLIEKNAISPEKTAEWLRALANLVRADVEAIAQNLAEAHAIVEAVNAAVDIARDVTVSRRTLTIYISEDSESECFDLNKEQVSTLIEFLTEKRGLM